MSTIIQIVKAQLLAIGADGLVMPDAGCACELSDLAPCGGHFGDCRPGWKGAPSDPDHGEWSMYTSPEAAQESKATP